MINCHDLICDPMIIGHLDQRKVEMLIADFREELVTPPVVASVDGKNYLLNGAHVVEAMKRIYEGQEHKIPCLDFICKDWNEVWEKMMVLIQSVAVPSRHIKRAKHKAEKSNQGVSER